MSDTPLSKTIARAKQGDSKAFDTLWGQYAPILQKWARIGVKWHIDPDEAQSVVLLALWCAICHWNAEKGTFPGFLDLVLHNRVGTARRTAWYEKNKIHLLAARLDEPISEGATKTFAESYPDTQPSPFEQLVEKESEEEIYRVFAERLTTLEYKAVLARASHGGGHSNYCDALVAQGYSRKSVDNALQRARQKLKSWYEEVLA